MQGDSRLADWRARALRLEEQVNSVMVSQAYAVRRMLIAVFARGHVLLEGDVGVGKTTLLRAMARGLGGGYERLEGTVDLMPSDLAYHTYIDEDGKPRVEPGPVLRHGESLATFFFNEINRARPQVHSLLLRLMAERSMNAFNREHHFPHLLVFADRTRVEREETFELPAAARDRFFMEIGIAAPETREARRALMFDPKFHDADALIESVDEGLVDYTALNAFASELQNAISVSETLQNYALDLWQAMRDPAAEASGGSELVVEVKWIGVAAREREPSDVGVRKGLFEVDVVADLDRVALGRREGDVPLGEGDASHRFGSSS